MVPHVTRLCSLPCPLADFVEPPVQGSIGVYPPHLNLEVFRPRSPAPCPRMRSSSSCSIAPRVRSASSPTCAVVACCRSCRTERRRHRGSCSGDMRDSEPAADRLAYRNAAGRHRVRATARARGRPRRDFADRDWDRAEQPYPLRGTPDAPRQGAVDISNVEFVRASRWAARSIVKAC